MVINVKISTYHNIFAKDYNPYRPEEVSLAKKVKNTMPWICVISDLNGKESVAIFYKKELQKTNQTEFRVEKVVKRKVINYMPNGKVMTIRLIFALIKRTI